MPLPQILYGPHCSCFSLFRISWCPSLIDLGLQMIDDVHGVVSSTAGQNHYVRILSTINRELLKPNTSVALHRYSNSVVDTLPNEADSAISMMQMTEKPDTSYADIGGLDIQKQEVTIKNHMTRCDEMRWHHAHESTDRCCLFGFLPFRVSLSPDSRGRRAAADPFPAVPTDRY